MSSNIVYADTPKPDYNTALSYLISNMIKDNNDTYGIHSPYNIIYNTSQNSNAFSDLLNIYQTLDCKYFCIYLIEKDKITKYIGVFENKKKIWDSMLLVLSNINNYYTQYKENILEWIKINNMNNYILLY